MTYTVVLPSIVPGVTKRCLRSMSPRFRRRVHLVDNTVFNRGVPASWNLGAKQAAADGSEWLVILSAGVTFGAAGGDDFAAALDDPAHADEIAVEAADGIGWHLIAFAVDSWQAVGGADERFWPAYYEDADLATRLMWHYDLNPDVQWWPKVPVDATHETAHALTVVKVDFMANMGRYIDKHGGEPGQEKYRRSRGTCGMCGDTWEFCKGRHRGRG